MKTFIEAIIGLVIATLGIGGVVVGVMAAMLKSPAGVIALAGATMLVVAMCGTLAVVVGIWLWDWVTRSTLEHAQAAEFIKPDEHGRLPLSVDAMRHPAFITQVLNTYPQSYMQNVTTYSPRNDHRGQLPEIAPPLVPPMVAPPSFAELYSTNQLPRNGYLLGYNVEDGKPIIGNAQKIFSTLLGGTSGTGKSTVARLIAAQAALQSAKFVVIDPHFAAGEESLGESLRPLFPLMLRDVAADDTGIVDALGYVLAVGRDRLAGKDRDRWPLMLIVDETTAILQRGATAKILLDVLGQIAQETRKVNVIAVCMGQNFHSKVMDTVVRDSFASFLSCRTRESVAQTMSGNKEFARIAGSLEIGQAVWLTARGEQYTINVPNTTADDLTAISGEYTIKSALPLENKRFPSASQALPVVKWKRIRVHPEALGKRKKRSPEALGKRLT